jgi:transposase InsO family protein
MKYQFIHRHRRQFPVRVLCRVLDVTVSSYYGWGKRPPSARQQANQRLLEQIRQVHQASRQTYGSPRVHAELNAQGVSCGRHRVARLMRQEQLRGQRAVRRVRTTWSEHGLPMAPNRLQRDFQAKQPNHKWVSDLTYIPTREGWLYLAVVLDLYSRRIVGWAMDSHMTSELVCRALQMALQQRRPAAALVHHSDRGSQYASGDYRQLLEQHGLLASMSGTGNCYDNAVVESFFATLKTELIHRYQFHRRAQARTAIFAYLEGFYNRQRRHSTLGYLSPVDFELSHATSLSSVST